jgi:hypothetical protein
MGRFSNYVAGQKLSRPTAIGGIVDTITLVKKYNYGWLVKRSSNLNNVEREFVYAERYIQQNYK